MSDSAEVRRMGTRSKAGETASNTSRISPRRRNIVLGAGAVRSSTVEKAKDGSLIYKRRSSIGSNSTQSVSPSPETEQTSIQKGQSAPAESHEHKRMRTIHTNSAGEEVESDAFCWLCHREGDGVCCELCPRMYHLKCLNIESVTTTDWVCPECEKILQAECVDTRSRAMSLITVDQLCVLLKYALQRMKHTDSADFHKPVDLNAVPHYTDYIQTPMDLTTLEKNIRKKLYGSTEAFLADAKYILHNCIVFNGERNKLTSNAKMVLKICKHEMNEIEICPDCYMNSCTKQQENWFCEPCRYPHTLVWAKMKGYPYWPAKALRVVNGQVDVRFFGEHDRAWVPVGQVYLLSKDPPVSIKKGRGGYDQSMEELNLHIQRLKNKFGSFEYAPNKMVYDPYAHMKDTEDGMVTPTKSSTKSPNSTPSSTKSRSPGITPSLRAATPKTPEKSPSIVTRTASAVKLKYSSIISTRHTKLKGQTIGDNVIVTTDNKPSGESSLGGNSTCKYTEESEEPTCKKARLVESSVCSEDPLEEKQDLSANGKDLMEVTVEQNKKTEEFNPSGGDQKMDGSAGDEKLTKVFLLDEHAIKETKPSKNLTSLLDIVPKVKHTDKKVIDEIENKIKHLQEDDDDDINKKGSKGDMKDDNKGEVKSDNKCDAKSDNGGDGNVSETADNPSESKDVVVSGNQTVGSVDVAESQDTTVKALQATSSESELSGTKSSEAVSDDKLKPASQSPKKNTFLEKIVASCKEKLGVEKAEDAELSLKLSISEAEDDSHSSNVSTSSTESMSDISKCTDKSPEKNESKTHGTSSSALEKHVLMEVTESISVTMPEVGNKNQKIKDSSQKKGFGGTKSNPIAMETDAVETIPTSCAPSSHSDAKPSVSSPRGVNEKLDSRDVIVITDADSHEDTTTKEITERRCDAQRTPDARGSSDVRCGRLKSPDVSISQKSSPGPIKIKPQNVHMQKPQTATVLPEKVTPQPQRSGISLVNGSDMHSTSPSKEQDAIPSDFSPNTPEIDFTGLNLSRYTNKVMMTVQSTLQEFCMDMINTDAGSVFRKHLQLEVKRLEWRHQQEINEIRHTANLKLLELRAAMELEKEKAIENLIRELKFKYEAEKKQAVEETKKKQWCANCGKEAIFYCCWNTSYCDYPCQQAHWPHHMSSCTQSQSNQQSHDTRTNQSDTASNSAAINVEKWQPSETQANRVITQTASVIHSHPHNVQFIRPPQRLPASQVGGSVLRYIQPNAPNPGQRFQHNNPQQFQLSAMNQMNQSQPPLIMVSTGPTHQGQLRPIISHNARGPQSLLLPQAGRLPPNMMQGSGMHYRPDF